MPCTPLLVCGCVVFVASAKDNTSLVEEFAIGVLSEQGLSDGGCGGFLQETQSSLQGVVDIDLALSTDDEYTTSTIIMLANAR